jgi:acyl-CoA dehydrogenase
LKAGLQDRDEGAEPRPPAHRRLLRRQAQRLCDESATTYATDAQAVRQADRRTSAGAGHAGRQPGRDLCRALHGAGRARRFDAGERIIQQAHAACKLFCSEMVGRVADRAVQIHGGAGYMQDYPVEHFYRDVRLFRLYEGTTQIQQIIIAREMCAQR